MKASRFGGAAIALGTVALMLGAGLVAEWRLRREPPPRSILLGGRPVDELIARWAPCCEVVPSPQGDEIVTTPTQAGLADNFAWRMPLKKSPDRLRLAVLGESGATGLGVAVRSVQSNGRLETLNCSAGGLNVPQLKRRWDEIKPFAPDATILLFGHNLYNGNQPYLTRQRFRYYRLLGRSRLFVAAVQAIFSKKPPSWTLRAVEFEALLRRMAAERGKDHQLVFCTVPVNHWFPPVIEPPVRGNPLLNEATLLHWLGRDDEAIATLKAFIAAGDTIPWPHFMIGDLSYAHGRTADARREFRIVSERFQPADLLANRIILRVARETGVDCVDINRFLVEKSEHGIPGWDWMGDRIHLVPEGAQFTVAECLKRIAPNAPGGASGWRTTPGQFSIRDRLRNVCGHTMALTDGDDEDRARVIEYAAGRLVLRGDPALPAALEECLSMVGDMPGRPERNRAVVLLGFARGHWRAGLRDEAMRLGRRAAEADPAWAPPVVQNGLFLLATDRRAEALEEFGRALRIDPRRPDASHFLRRLSAPRKS